MTSVSVPTLFPFQSSCTAYSRTPAVLTDCVLFGKNFACPLTSPLNALTIIGSNSDTELKRYDGSFERPSIQDGSSLSTVVSGKSAFNVGNSNVFIGNLVSYNGNITSTGSVVIASRGIFQDINSNVVCLQTTSSTIYATSTIFEKAIPANSVKISTSKLIFPNLARTFTVTNGIFGDPVTGKLKRKV